MLARAGREAAAPAGPDRPGRRGSAQAAAAEAKIAAGAGRRAAAGQAGRPAGGRRATCARSLGGVRPDRRSCPRSRRTARALPVLGRYDVVVIGGGTAGPRPASPRPGRGPRRWSSSTSTAWAAWAPSGPSPATTGATASASPPPSPAATSLGHRAEDGVVAQRAARRPAPTSGSARSAAGPWSRTDSVRRRGRRHAAGPRRGAGQGGDRRHGQRRRRRGRRRRVHLHRRLGVRHAGHRPAAAQLGATYTNTDFTITDETDMVDVWHLFVYAKDKYPEAFDQGQLIDTRERRRIVGDFTITLLDQINERTYPDTIVRGLQQLRHARLHGRSLPDARAPGARRASTSTFPIAACCPRGWRASW